MDEFIDLNVFPLDLYPILKVLTRSDMTTSQLVLPKIAVEEHIVSVMDDSVKEKLSKIGGRANIWVVDDQMCREYYLTIVDRDHRFSIISWGHVLKFRELKEGQRLKFGWINEKLHFVVLPDEENNPDERASNNSEHNGSHGDKRASPDTADDTDEPAAKKLKQIMTETSNGIHCTQALEIWKMVHRIDGGDPWWRYKCIYNGQLLPFAPTGTFDLWKSTEKQLLLHPLTQFKSIESKDLIKRGAETERFE